MKLIIALIILSTASLLSQETIWEIEDADSIKSEIKLSKYKEYFYYQNSNNEYVVRKVEDGSEYQRFTVDGELITINEKFDSYYYHNSGTFTKQEFGGEKVEFWLDHYKSNRPFWVYTNPYIDQAYIFSMDSIYRLDESTLSPISILEFKYNEFNSENNLPFKGEKRELYFQKNNPEVLLKPTIKIKNGSDGILSYKQLSGNLFEIYKNSINDISNKVQNRFTYYSDNGFYLAMKYKYSFGHIRVNYDIIYKQETEIQNYIYNLSNTKKQKVDFNKFYKSYKTDYVTFFDEKENKLVNHNLKNNFINRKISIKSNSFRAVDNILYSVKGDSLMLINANDANIIKTFFIGSANQLIYSKNNNFIIVKDKVIKQISIDKDYFDHTISLFGPNKAKVGDSLVFETYSKDIKNPKWSVNGSKNIGNTITYIPKEHGRKIIKVYENVNGKEISSYKILDVKQADEPIITHKIVNNQLLIYCQLEPSDINVKWEMKGELVSENDTLKLDYKNDAFKINYKINNSITEYSGEYEFVTFDDEETIENPVNFGLDEEVSRIISNNNGFVGIIHNNKDFSLWKNEFYFENKNTGLKDSSKIAISRINEIAFIDTLNYLNYLTSDGSIENISKKINGKGEFNFFKDYLILKEKVFDKSGNLIADYSLSDMQEIYENHQKIVIQKDDGILHHHYFWHWSSMCYSRPNQEKYNHYLRPDIYDIYNNTSFVKRTNATEINFGLIDYNIKLFGKSTNTLYHGRISDNICRHITHQLLEFPLTYGYAIKIDDRIYENTEIENIIDYIYPEFYFEYNNQIYSKNIETDIITRINLKGEYIAHSVDLYHTWILTKEGENYYLTDLNPEEPPTTSVEEINEENININNELIELNGAKGEYQIADVSGKLIRKSEFYNQIYLNDLEAGIYLIQIQTENKTITKKIIRY